MNLGLRYDFITPAMEAENHQTNFNPAGSGSLVFAKDGSLKERGLVNPDKNNFAPRIGIVFRADDKTVIRGGYGIFYNLFDRVGSEDQMSLNLPGPDQQRAERARGGPDEPALPVEERLPRELPRPDAPPASSSGSSSAPWPRTRPRPPSTRRASECSASSSGRSW